MKKEELVSLPIIIGGCFRTGTTLLRRILDTHSRIHCPPEIKFFRDLYGNYIKDKLKNLRFFKTARQMGLNEDELLSLFGGAFVKSHELAAEKLSKVRWADKNPENVLYMEQWQRLLNGRFLFIHVVRNPLDTVASLIEVGFEKTLPPNFKGRVKVYQQYTEAGEAFSHKYPEKSFVIRYEDLVEQPTAAVERLMDFLDEEYEPAMIASFNAPGRQKGLEDPKISSTRSIHVKSIGRWKADLTRRRVKYVYRECRSLFSRFEYPAP